MGECDGLDKEADGNAEGEKKAAAAATAAAPAALATRASSTVADTCRLESELAVEIYIVLQKSTS